MPIELRAASYPTAFNNVKRYAHGRAGVKVHMRGLREGLGAITETSIF
jgi:hypothetical protein